MGTEFEVKIGEETHKVEIDAVPSDKVDQIRAQAHAQGASKIQAEMDAKLNELQAKLDEAEKAKNQNGQKLSEDQQRIQTLTQTVEKLTQSMTDLTEREAKATFEKTIVEATQGKNLVAGAIDVFRQSAMAAKQSDGSLLLPDGTTGDAKKFADQFFGSDLGKRMILSDQRGGAGTNPSGANGQDLSTREGKVKHVQSEGVFSFAQKAFAEAQANLAKTKP